MALTYIFERILFHIVDFFHHWYVDGTKHLANYTVSFFARLDRTLALRVTARHFFEPLYGDYTITGHIMGFLFRLVRVVLGLFIYACLVIAFIGVAIAWLLLPAILILYVIYSIFIIHAAP